MTASFPETKTGPRFGLASAALAGCLATVLLAGLPVRAEDANPVLAKVNGAEIRQSDMALAEEELGPSLAQMDPATKQENVLSFLIDMKIVAKAAEAKKIEDRDDFKARLAFARNRLLMDNLLSVEGKAATTDEAMKKVYEEAAKQISGEQEVHARHILVETEDEAKAIKARMLINNGAADTFISAEAIEKFKAALDSAGVKYQFENYPGAVHSFTVKDADKHGNKGMAYNEAADTKSWQHMRELFKETLGK